MPLRLRWLGPLLFLGCLDTFAPPGAMSFTPPPVYRTWWEEIEACAQLTGDFDQIQWYEVPGSEYACPAYTSGCAGWWQPPHTIYMAQTRLDDRRLVEHEMLHDLLQRSDHPPVFRQCGL